MSWYIVVVMLIVGSWMLLFMTLGFADRMARHRVGTSLEVRRWEETMQAMRRMADEEGDA